jgi:hypothetical protein
MRLYVIATAISVLASQVVPVSAGEKNPATRQYLFTVLGNHPVQSADAVVCFSTEPSLGSTGRVLAGLPKNGGCHGKDESEIVRAETPERLLPGKEIVLLKKPDGSWLAISKD